MAEHREFDKQCSHCHVFFPFSMFPANSKTKDGLSSWCRNCRGADSSRRSRLRSKPVVEEVQLGKSPWCDIRTATRKRRIAAWRN